MKAVQQQKKPKKQEADGTKGQTFQSRLRLQAEKNKLRSFVVSSYK